MLANYVLALSMDGAMNDSDNADGPSFHNDVSLDGNEEYSKQDMPSPAKIKYGHGTSTRRGSIVINSVSHKSYEKLRKIHGNYGSEKHGSI